MLKYFFCFLRIEHSLLPASLVVLGKAKTTQPCWRACSSSPLAYWRSKHLARSIFCLLAFSRDVVLHLLLIFFSLLRCRRTFVGEQRATFRSVQ